MECSEKLVWKNFDRRELMKIKIEPPEKAVTERVKRNWDGIAKPIDGMGKLETLTAQIGGILGTEEINLSKKAVIIMCADNGIVAEGVSQSGQEITTAVAKNMGKGKSSVGRMAAAIGADTIPVDIGVNYDGEIDGVLKRKIRRGTENFSKKPAMTEQETIRAISVGIELVRSCKEQGYTLLGTGEMGIGNTTTSSAVAAALLGCGVCVVTGRGAGLDDAGLSRKQKVIAAALEKYHLYEADALMVLQTVGGLDIAGLAGVCMGGAIYHVPIVLDGVISMTAALAAETLLPGTVDYLLPSHKGKEPAAEKLAERLGMEPVIDGKLALGEGTGAVLMFSLLDMALSVYRSGSTFQDAAIEQYRRYENGEQQEICSGKGK